MNKEKNPYNNYLLSNRNPDGSPDARRGFLGTAGRLALGALMLAPFAGNIARVGKMIARNPMRAANVGAENIKRGATQLYNNPMSGVEQGSKLAGRIFKTSKDYYGNQLNRARDYFGV